MIAFDNLSNCVMSPLVLKFCFDEWFWVSRYKWDKNEKHLKPETGLLQLREGLKVFANLRPASVLPQVCYAVVLGLRYLDC